MGLFSRLASAIFPSRTDPTIKTQPPEQQQPNTPPKETDGSGTAIPYLEPPIQLFTEWTTQAILDALTAHELGDFSASGKLWEWMGRDDRMQTELNKRDKGLNSLPFKLETASKKEGNKEEEDAKATLEEQWYQCIPEETVSSIIRCEVGMGFAMCRIFWDARRDSSGRLLWWPRLKLWAPQFCYYDDFLKKWRVQTEKGFEYITPGDGQWFLYMPSGDRGWLNGCVRSLALPCFVTNFDWQDWASFNDAVGHPIKVAYIARGTSKPNVDKFLANLVALGRLTSYLLCQKNTDDTGYDFEYKIPQNIATGTFKDSIDYSNKAKTLVLLGQMLTTDSGPSLGGSGGAEVHKLILGTILRGDANSLSTTIRAQLLTWWSYWNLGNSQLAPWPDWDTTPPEDKAAKAKTITESANALEKVQASLKGTGKVIDVVAFWEDLGVVLVDAKQDVGLSLEAQANMLRTVGYVLKSLREAMQGTGKQLDFEAVSQRFGIPVKDGEAPLLPGQQGAMPPSEVPTEAPAPAP